MRAARRAGIQLAINTGESERESNDAEHDRVMRLHLVQERRHEAAGEQAAPRPSASPSSAVRPAWRRIMANTALPGVQ